MTLLRILLAVVLLALPGASAPSRIDARPALWVVRDADTTIYLFGTIHVLPRGVAWFDGGVKAAFDASDALVLELVLPEPEAMRRLVAEMGMRPWALDLPPADRAKLARTLADLALAPDALDHMEPWLAATTLSVRALERIGYGSGDGVEAILHAAAVKAGKPVAGLETPRAQFALFDSLSDTAQRSLLVETIDGLPKIGATMARTTAAWRDGDAEALAALVNADLAHSPELARRLLTDRNAAWSDWVAARMAEPGTVFVAVGAGHLAGGRSVQAMLARRGMTVQQVAD
jgi:uncharacterized protein YbaP (TraB family)